jgi:hypothetical protein
MTILGDAKKRVRLLERALAKADIRLGKYKTEMLELAEHLQRIHDAHAGAGSRLCPLADDLRKAAALIAERGL